MRRRAAHDAPLEMLGGEVVEVGACFAGASAEPPEDADPDEDSPSAPDDPSDAPDVGDVAPDDVPPTAAVPA